jgi:hypothetical protein
MAAGAAVFVVLSGASRAWLGVEQASSSRYLSLIAALLLPSIAIAVDAIFRWSRPAGVVAAAVLLVGVPGNFANTATDFRRSTYRSERALILSLAHMPLARRVPRDLEPDPNTSNYVTVGWLLDGARSGRIPRARPATARERSEYTLRLSVQESPVGEGRGCGRLSQSTVVTLRSGQRLAIHGAVFGQLLAPGRRPSPLVRFGTTLNAPSADHVLLAVVPRVTFRIVPASADASACRVT